MLEVLQDISAIMIYVMGVIIIGLVLLQGGAGDVSSAFGGGGQLDGALGVGANKKLAKITGWLSFLFIVMILILAVKPAPDFTATPGALSGEGGEGGEGTEAVVPEMGSGEDSPPAMIDPDADASAAPALEAETVEEALSPGEEGSTAPQLADPPPPPAASDGSGVSFGDPEAETPEESEAPAPADEDSPDAAPATEEDTDTAAPAP